GCRTRTRPQSRRTRPSGMGLSSHPAGGYEKKTQAADIRSVLTQLGIDRAAVVGHDIGATVAYAYAARYPDNYSAFYAQPGAMHSAFAQFLSIPKDAEDNKVSMTTKLTMPVLAIGAAKAFGANVAIVMRNAADNVTEALIANSGHWLMDEQPTATIAAVRNFLDRKTTAQS